MSLALKSLFLSCQHAKDWISTNKKAVYWTLDWFLCLLAWRKKRLINFWTTDFWNLYFINELYFSSVCSYFVWTSSFFAIKAKNAFLGVHCDRFWKICPQITWVFVWQNIGTWFNFIKLFSLHDYFCYVFLSKNDPIFLCQIIIHSLAKKIWIIIFGQTLTILVTLGVGTNFTRLSLHTRGFIFTLAWLSKKVKTFLNHFNTKKQDAISFSFDKTTKKLCRVNHLWFEWI